MNKKKTILVVAVISTRRNMEFDEEYVTYRNQYLHRSEPLFDREKAIRNQLRPGDSLFPKKQYG